MDDGKVISHNLNLIHIHQEVENLYTIKFYVRLLIRSFPAKAIGMPFVGIIPYTVYIHKINR